MTPATTTTYTTADDTAETGAKIEHGAGRNPSTSAGLVVLMALGVLVVLRRSFARYM